MNDEGYRNSHTASGYEARYSKTYTEGFYSEQWKRIEQPLLEQLLIKYGNPGMTALDLACGNGRILGVLLGAGFDAEGIDISQEMLKGAKQRFPTARLHVADLTAFEPESVFDLITCFRFFLNAEEDLRTSAAQSIARLLRVGGVAIVNIHVTSSSPLGSAYRVRNRFGRSPTKVATWDLPGLDDCFRAAGMRVVDVRPYSALPRIGPLFPRWYGRLMLPAERIVSRLPRSFRLRLSQSFVAVLERH
jgi:SAM-dependent methyltransferase